MPFYDFASPVGRKPYMVTKSSAKTKEKEIRDSRKECEQSKARVSKLDTLIEKLYEDNVEGKISDERFMKMTTSYEAEQKQLEERVVELQKNIYKYKKGLPILMHSLIRFISIQTFRNLMQKLFAPLLVESMYMLPKR